LILDEPKQFLRRRGNSQSTPGYPSVETPCSGGYYHKGPGNVWLFEPVRDEHSRSRFLQCGSTSNVIPVSMSQKNQLDIARLAAEIRDCFQYPLLATGHAGIDKHEPIVRLDKVGVSMTSRYPIDPFSHFQQCKLVPLTVTVAARTLGQPK